MNILIPASAFAKNCRLLCYAIEPEHPEKWGQILGQRCGLEPRISYKLLTEEDLPGDEVISKISAGFAVEADPLRFSFPVVQLAEPILQLNLRRLLKELPRGGQQRVAQQIGKAKEQLSRWRNGSATPERKSLMQLQRALHLDANIDLNTEPLFLSLEPLAPLAKKEWLMDKIKKMSVAELAPFILPISRMLRLNEPSPTQSDSNHSPR